MDTFETELQDLINRYSLENGSATPDFILASYMKRCLDNWNTAVREREAWYDRPIKGVVPAPIGAK